MNGIKINTSKDRFGEVRYYLATTVRDGNKTITKTSSHSAKEAN